MTFSLNWFDPWPGNQHSVRKSSAEHFRACVCRRCAQTNISTKLADKNVRHAPGPSHRRGHERTSPQTTRARQARAAAESGKDAMRTPRRITRSRTTWKDNARGAGASHPDGTSIGRRSVWCRRILYTTILIGWALHSLLLTRTRKTITTITTNTTRTERRIQTPETSCKKQEEVWKPPLTRPWGGIRAALGRRWNEQDQMRM